MPGNWWSRLPFKKKKKTRGIGARLLLLLQESDRETDCEKSHRAEQTKTIVVDKVLIVQMVLAKPLSLKKELREIRFLIALFGGFLIFGSFMN